ncbi:MAG: type III-A CRISPR-associated protein Cas10/Csm1 [Chitinophagales bacterium]|nr:MAG: type III-A CRISPR-associated protein Cas10/Csm1 [Chitinophagales bacterium]
MKVTRDQIYLAALLHDIGKFFQRADSAGAARSALLKKEIKNLESRLCPQRNNVYSHKHVLWTAQFLDNYASYFKKMLNLNESAFDELLLLAAAHHKPSSFSELIIQKADHYSSGADRVNEEAAWKDAEQENDNKWDAFKRIPMKSIFEGVKLDEGTAITYHHNLPVKAIEFSENYFPSKNNVETGYGALWERFNQEFQQLNTQSFRAFTGSLLFLLEKFATRIPSSTEHLPDVSLYDHLKTTAAFAVCLYDYIQDEIKEEKLPGKSDKPFVLIGGDLSGIQQYIYGIAMRNAAKNLKGRSFYLHLLCDNIVCYILDKLSLFDANVIYSSGGGFYILAPHTKQITETIKKLHEEISEKILNRHHNDLFLSLHYEPFGEAELFSEYKENHIGQIWTKLAESLNKIKLQRNKHLLKRQYEKFFVPFNVGGEKKTDAFDGQELDDNDRKQLDGGDNYVSAYNYALIQLGKRLKSAGYWIISNQELPYLGNMHFRPVNLPYYNYFLNAKEIEEQRTQLAASADDVRVYAFDPANYLNNPVKGNRNIYGFQFYGGNDYPKNLWLIPKTFEELAGVEFEDKRLEKRKKAPQLVRLGFLRMDVDNLGQIFRTGISEKKRSFSRYCTLSRSLDYFFKGYVNRIWESHEEYKNFTQIIYAGGDDLFIVGKWDILLNMAYDIYQWFRKWTCYSNAFTLSGGMAILPPKFPLLKAAAIAEKLEKAAKSHRFNQQSKNAFAFFNFTEYHQGNHEEIIFSFNWEKEFPYIYNLKNELKKHLSAQNALPAGFVTTVYTLMQMARFRYQAAKDIYEPTQRQFIWITAYQFKRSAAGFKPNDPVHTFLMQWVQHIATGRVENGQLPTRYHALQLLAVAARWAAYELRK